MKIFITGANGFVGRVLVQQLLATTAHEIVALSRRRRPGSIPENERLTWIGADLLDIAACRDALAGCKVIVHLAAATGKLDPHVYEHVHVEGTRRLLAVAKDSGNPALLNVSTIAARFPDISSYPYAKSKLRAEKLVAKSGLRFTTVRPTIVIGPGSGVWDGFQKLATAPAAIIFGPGNVEIQPVHVDDLVGCLIAIVDRNRFKSEVLELGGPEETTISEFWAAIRKSAGKKPWPRVHAPLMLVLPMLRVAEMFVYRFLPLTVGQLSTFRFSSVPVANTFQLMRAGSMMGIEAMIASARSSRPESEFEPVLGPEVETECQVFCRHLIGEEPSAYVLSRYRAGLLSKTFKLGAPGGFDTLLNRVAATNPFFAGAADAYSRFLRPNSLVRRKIILLLAILESTPASPKLEQGDDCGVVVFFFRCAAATLMTGVRLAVGSALFLPLQILTAVLVRK